MTFEQILWAWFEMLAPLAALGLGIVIIFKIIERFVKETE